MPLDIAANIQINGPVEGRAVEILTPEALAFVADLHRRFDARRRELLAARTARQARFDAGELPDFLPRPPTSGPPTGPSRRSRPTCRTAGSRSPVPSTAR
jgi:malate synthase